MRQCAVLEEEGPSSGQGVAALQVAAGEVLSGLKGASMTVEGSDVSGGVRSATVTRARPPAAAGRDAVALRRSGLGQRKILLGAPAMMQQRRKGYWLFLAQASLTPISAPPTAPSERPTRAPCAATSERTSPRNAPCSPGQLASPFAWTRGRAGCRIGRATFSATLTVGVAGASQKDIACERARGLRRPSQLSAGLSRPRWRDKPARPGRSSHDLA
jgi:hypothetical protein